MTIRNGLLEKHMRRRLRYDIRCCVKVMMSDFVSFAQYLGERLGPEFAREVARAMEECARLIKSQYASQYTKRREGS